MSTDDELLTFTLADVSPVHWAFHALDLHLHQIQCSQSQYYSKLQADEDFAIDHELYGHMGGGAQASTTNCLEYLFIISHLLACLLC